MPKTLASLVRPSPRTHTLHSESSWVLRQFGGPLPKTEGPIVPCWISLLCFLIIRRVVTSPSPEAPRADGDALRRGNTLRPHNSYTVSGGSDISVLVYLPLVALARNGVHWAGSHSAPCSQAICSWANLRLQWADSLQWRQVPEVCAISQLEVVAVLCNRRFLSCQPAPE